MPKPLIWIQGLAVMGFCASLLAGCRSGNEPAAVKGWQAPKEAAALKSPFTFTSQSADKGKSLYNMYCWNCHGKTGNGDGAAGKSLGQQPANFHSDRVKKQPDGALFWKLSHGNGNMPPFKEVLTEEQRWQLISYIRVLGEQNTPLVPPQPLDSSLQVQHYMPVAPQAVRLLVHPQSGDLYYTTFEGNVFHITDTGNGTPASEQIISVKHHGINRLQGAIFHNHLLFLCGNVDAGDKKSTTGRMVRFDLSGKDPLSAKRVFDTDTIPANKTIFDHGWNALAVSLDGQFIYVNSGARTDHGEVQDNGGLFPNARDNALTAKIFRFPIQSENLHLRNDTAWLRRQGFIYAEGIRNAYDMAFDNKGHLFAVSNSSDYDHPEDMFWVRQGRHYGFPWIMGGVENPQQYPDWQPDPETNPFIQKISHSWEVKYFKNDKSFPPIPAGIKFTPGVWNMGPDANEYRGHSGKILDGDLTGVPITTFTAHSSPLGLVFDLNQTLGGHYSGDAFVIRYSQGATMAMMKPFTNEGSDLLHLHLSYDPATDNFWVRTQRVVAGFQEPTDAVLKGNNLYVIEYGGRGGHIWKISFPPAAKLVGTSKKHTFKS